MKCQQQLSVRSSAGVLEAPSGYALRCLQDIKAKRTVYLLRNRTSLFATNTKRSIRYVIPPAQDCGHLISRSAIIQRCLRCPSVSKKLNAG